MKRWLRGFLARKRGVTLARRLSSEHPLPSFPQSTMDALKLLRDPTATPEAIASSIEQNPGLVVQLLRTVNSAAFGLRREVTRASHAINLLGRTQVESLVVGVAVQKQLGGLCRDRLLEGHWGQAALRASVARSFAKVMHPETQSESFVAGMLLDMALPLLVSVHPKRYDGVLERWYADEDAELALLEREAIGCDHAEVGAEMARRWELPSIICDAIERHHDGEVTPALSLAAAIRADLDVDDLVRRAQAHGLPPELSRQITVEAQANAAELATLFR